MRQPSVPDAQFEPAPTDQMAQIMGDLGRMYQERNRALEQVSRAHHEALLLLSMAAEYKDDDTGIHIVRIGFLAEALALFLGQSPGYARMLRRAAPMHDIGKIGIPDHVLKKPGPLTSLEREVMNGHTVIGANILGKSRNALFQLAAEIALCHHERWDGSGYPNQLSGCAIPLSGRVVAVADFYDALTMDRVYRKAFGHQQALQMLQEQSGRAFDPDIVSCFLRHSAEILALRQRVILARQTFSDLVHGEEASP